jgi:hypothetical protein
MESRSLGTDDLPLGLEKRQGEPAELFGPRREARQIADSPADQVFQPLASLLLSL